MLNTSRPSLRCPDQIAERFLHSGRQLLSRGGDLDGRHGSHAVLLSPSRSANSDNGLVLHPRTLPTAADEGGRPPPQFLRQTGHPPERAGDRLRVKPASAAAAENAPMGAERPRDSGRDRRRASLPSDNSGRPRRARGASHCVALAALSPGGGLLLGLLRWSYTETPTPSWA